jgi:hypothetical protein
MRAEELSSSPTAKVTTVIKESSMFGLYFFDEKPGTIY